MAADNREEKRSRLGNRQQRGIWRKARAYKHPWYAMLSERARRLNGNSGERSEITLDREMQAQIMRDREIPEWAK